MRRPMEKEPGRPLAGWVLLALLCAMLFWVGAAFLHRDEAAEAAAIPNDLFAVPAAAGMEGEAAPAQKIVCLTFDDGPSQNTAKILAVLHEHAAPATFFVTAQEVNADYLPLVADIAAQGHQVALHSASHSYKKIYESTSAFWLDIKELRQALAPYVDVESIRWLRFPGGSTNTVSHKYGGRGIMKSLIRQAAEKGYEWIDWNVCAEDATRSHPDAGQILENIQRDAEGHDICVVLMHDTKATGETVKALPSVIEWFAGEGYRFMTVEQMHAARQGGTPAGETAT